MISAAASTATATVSTTVIVQEKAQCVNWLSEKKATATVQHNFHHIYGTDSPAGKVI
jgi:hypothetical protein